jgi:hypothetical protein
MKNSQIIYPVPVEYPKIDLSWIIGRNVINISFSEPTLWNFSFGKNAFIGVECLWRIIKNKKILLTNEDHKQQFGLPESIDAVKKGLSLLSKQKIISVQLIEFTADLLIEFSQSYKLEIIPVSSGYESWQILTPSGVSYYAQGGGQICEWKP